MKEMTTFLYLFRDEPSLLTDNAANNIIQNGLVYWGQDWGKHLTFRTPIGSFVCPPVVVPWTVC